MVSHDDLAMLRRWHEQRDAEAFHDLVRRHAGMVYGTCRRILKSSTEAEDAAQDCFEQLATTAKAPERHVGAWLHKLATNLCINRLRSQHRRDERERRFWGAAEPLVDATWDDLYAYVDEAMAALPEELRIPITLHFLESETHETIAAALGTSRRNVGYRIDKGIEQIRKSLRRRGIQVAGAALAAMLAANASEAAPAPLLAALGKLAMAGPSTATASASGAVMGGLGLIGLLTVKNALVATVGLAVVAGGVWGGLNLTRNTKPASSPAIALRAAPSPSAALPAMAPGPSPNTIVPQAAKPHAQSGSAAPDATNQQSEFVISGFVANVTPTALAQGGKPGSNDACTVVADFVTAQGRCSLGAPPSRDGSFSIAPAKDRTKFLAVGVRGYVFARCAATGEASEVVPITLGADGAHGIALALGPAGSISGIYIDKKSRPIQNGQIFVSHYAGLCDDQAITDANGAFSVGALPPGDYSLRSFGMNSPPAVHAVAVTRRPVKDIVLQEPTEVIPIEGRVTNRSGAPLDGAFVSTNSGDIVGFGIYATKADGRYLLKVSHDGEYRITASIVGFCPVSRMVTTGAGPADFTLSDPTGVIEGAVTRAADGQPIKEFTIDVTTKRSTLPLDGSSGTSTSNQTFKDAADGRFTLNFSESGEITLTARAAGFAPAQVNLAQLAPPQKMSNVALQLSPAIGLRGIVVDHQGRGVSGARITSQHWPLESPYSDSHLLTTTDENGGFTIDPSKTGLEELTAYHPDYTPKTVPASAKRDEKDILHIQLPKGATIEGRVTCGGQPAKGQTVQLTASYVPIGESTAVFGKSAVTGDNGKYQIKGLPEGNATVSLSYRRDAAQASSMQSSLTKSVPTHDGAVSVVDFELPARNATLAGRIRVDGAPPSQATARLLYESAAEPFGGENSEALVKPDGTFSMEGIPAGLATLAVTLTGPSVRERHAPIRLDVNRTTTCDVDFVAADCAVEGHVQAAGATPRSASFVVTVETALGTDNIQIRNNAFSDTFRIDGVPAGAVTLTTNFQFDRMPMLRKTKHFDVRAGEAAQADFSFGSGRIAIHLAGAAGNRSEMLILSGNIPDGELTKTPLQGFASLPSLCAVTQVSPEGLASVEGLEPGVYTIVALSIAGSNPSPRQTIANYPHATATVQVTEGQEAEANLALSR